MSNTENVQQDQKETAPIGNGLISQPYCNISSRRGMLAEMRQAIAGGVPIIVVSGEKGVGKSAFCKIAMGDIPDNCIPVYFSRTVESFEDVVRSIAGKVECDAVDVSRTGMNSTIDAIRECLESQRKRVVTVFDGAEMIYLATLERIRKMLDQVNASGSMMQVVLCGRPLLLENLRQLSICNFTELPEKRFELGPLEREDATAFVEFLSRHHAGGTGQALSADTVARIHQETGGNAGKICTCAVEILEGKDLDEVLSGTVGSVKKNSFIDLAEKAIQRVDIKKYSTRQVGAVAGLVLGIVLLMSFIWGDKPDEQQAPVAQQTSKQTSEQDDNVRPEAAGNPEKKGDAVKEKKEPVEQVVQEDVQETVEKSTVAAVPDVQQELKPEEPVPGAAELAGPEHVEVATPEDVGQEPTALDREVAVAPQGVEETPLVAGTEPVAEVEEVLNPEVQGSGTQREMDIAETEEAIEEPPEAAGVAALESEPAHEVPGEEAAEDQVVVETMSGDGKITALEPDEQAEATEVPVEIEEPERSENIEAGFIPLLRAEKKKVLLAQETPVEESNIVISSLSESEEREVVVIRNTSSAKKILPPMVHETELPSPDVAESGPERVEEQAVVPIPPPAEEEREVAGPPDTGKTKIRIPVVGAAIVPDFPAGEPSAPAPVTAAVDGSSVMAERLAAGRNWLTGAKDNRYTIQLMVLGADGAEGKVERILSDHRYSQEAGNLYLFKSVSATPAFFVFYGEYASMTEARNARNSIPAFLKEHRPYVLSIRGAMQKVKGS